MVTRNPRPGTGTPPPPPKPPKESWLLRLLWKLREFSPPQIRRYGTGVLFVFAIAAVISLQRFGGGDIVLLTTVAVIVFGFMVALFGFERLASPTSSQFYQHLGKALALVTLGSIVALFVYFLFLLANGELRGIIQGVQTKAPVVSRVDVLSESIIIYLEPLKRESEKVVATVLAGDGGPPPTLEENAVQVQGNHVAINGLKMATSYTVRMVTKSRLGSESAATDITRATRAVSFPLARVGVPGDFSWEARYTGPITVTTGRITSTEEGTINFSRTGERWQYRGPVLEGKAHGSGQLALLQSNGRCLEDSNPRVCKAECNSAQFDNGALVAAQCVLEFSPAAAYVGLDGQPIANTGEYKGGVVQVENSADAFEMGPHRAVLLDGPGVAVRHDGEVQEGIFKRGRLMTGAFHNRATGQFGLSRESSQVRDFEKTGPGMRMLPDGFQFGASGGSQRLKSGYRGQWIPSSTAANFQLEALNVSGDASPTGPRVPVSQNQDHCRYEEQFGLSGVKETMESKDWRYQPFDGFVELTLPRADVAVRVYAEPGKLPFVRILRSNTLDGVVDLDGESFQLDSHAVQVRAQLFFAKLCDAKTLTNRITGDQQQVTGLCPALGLLMSRAYFCAAGPPRG